MYVVNNHPRKNRLHWLHLIQACITNSSPDLENTVRQVSELFPSLAIPLSNILALVNSGDMEQASDSLKLLRSQTANPILRQAHITCHLTDEDKDSIIKQVKAGHTATSICNANHIDYNTLRQLKAEYGLPNVQRQHIRKFTTDDMYSALSNTNGDGKAAAAMLGVHPRTIDRRLKLNP